jgi:hypothetical protein
VLDDDHFPVIITKWSGETTEKLARSYFEAMDAIMQRAVAENTRVVQATDALEARRPPALTRKLLAELTDAQGDRYGEQSLSPTYLAMDNLLLRGTITAINWVSRSAIDVEPHPTLRSAIEAALARLDQENIPRPSSLDPATYDLPSPQASG